MEINKIRQALNIFAQKIDNKFFYIDKAWFYGSRFRKENRPDSDYDITIQVAWNGNNLNCLLEEIIEDQTGEKVKVDIKFYDYYNPEHTPVINEKMKKGNELIYNSNIF